MAAASKVKLKLLIDTKNQRVLFAEANKNTVDFLFFILSLPLGTVVRLLSNKGMLGCLGKLYESVENLDENYIQPNQSKGTPLKPRPPASSAASTPLLSLTCSETIEKATYTCSRGSGY
nr:uncharacterized protein LOC113723790 [Coffea arabica]